MEKKRIPKLSPSETLQAAWVCPNLFWCEPIELSNLQQGLSDQLKVIWSKVCIIFFGVPQMYAHVCVCVPCSVLWCSHHLNGEVPAFGCGSFLQWYTSSSSFDFAGIDMFSFSCRQLVRIVRALWVNPTSAVMQTMSSAVLSQQLLRRPFLSCHGGSSIRRRARQVFTLGIKRTLRQPVTKSSVTLFRQHWAVCH